MPVHQFKDPHALKAALEEHCQTHTCEVLASDSPPNLIGWWCNCDLWWTISLTDLKNCNQRSDWLIRMKLTANARQVWAKELTDMPRRVGPTVWERLLTEEGGV